MNEEYTLKKDDDGLLVRLHADLELSSVPAFKKEIGDLAASGDKVVVDLQDLPGLSSAAIGALISCQKMIKAKGGDFVIVNLSDELRHIFSLAHLDIFFTIC